MKLVHFRQAFAGYSEGFLRDIVLGLEREGARTRVLTLREDTEVFPHFHGTRVLRLPPPWNPLRAVPALVRRVRPDWVLDIPVQAVRLALARELLIDRPDAFVAHFGPEGWIAAPVCRALRIPLATIFYGYDASRNLRSPVWRRRYSSLFRTASWIFGVSRHTCDRLVDAGAPRERTHVQRLGVRCAEFPFAPPGARWSHGDPFRMLFVGRLTAKKAPDLLLRAAHHARTLVRDAGGPDLRLTLGGDGELRDATAQAVRDLDATRWVDLPGAVPRTEVAHLMRTHHIYVQHSVTAPDGDEEGQPVTLVEAAASGLPIVSTRHAGIPDVVRDGISGHIVDERDVTAMGARIADLVLAGPARWDEFGAAARAWVTAEFELDRTVRALHDHLQSKRR